MLVLSRDRDTTVRIGPDVKVKVLSIRKNRVKLGIEAPRDVRVWRDEVVSELAAHGFSPEEALGTSVDVDRFSSLIIEDDPTHARLISQALVECHVPNPTVLGTGADAVEALCGVEDASEKAVRPRLVLLDLRLPDMSGLEVLRRIRSTPQIQTTPVVVLSVEDNDSVVNDCLEAGANAFVKKSPDYDEFRRSVARIGAFWGSDSCVPESAVPEACECPPVRAK